MKRSRKVLSFLTAAAMLGGVAVPAEPLAQLGAVMMVRAEEETAPTSGTCGENVTWKYDASTKTLTISGTGEMESYGHYSYVPWLWFSYEDDIEHVSIEKGVTSISSYAMYSCRSLVSVTIPDSVTSIGHNAFYYCDSLTSVTIPDSVTSIGDEAFDHCTSLTSVTIPDGVTSIGDEAFDHCTSLTSVTIPDGVTSIGDFAFCWCGFLTSVTIPDSVMSIGDCAFYWCDSLTSVMIPDSVMSIGGSAFYYTPWLEAKLEENPLWIRNAILLAANSNIEGECVIPDGVTSIGDCAFEYCSSLTSVTIPDSVTSIGESAFEYCSDLTSVMIPDSVTSIGAAAFSCSSLTSITIKNPDCEIYDEPDTICNEDDWNTDVITFTGTIYGYENSTAQAYAEKYGYQFKSLGKAPVSDTLGDVTGDSVINAGDAAVTLSAAAAYGATGSYGDMTDAQIAAADIDGNGMVNASDAAYILQYAAIRGANGKDFDIRELVK